MLTGLHSSVCHHIVSMNSKDADRITQLCVIILCLWTAKILTRLHSSVLPYCINEQQRHWPNYTALYHHIMSMNSKDPDQITQLCVIILCQWTVKPLTRLYCSVIIMCSWTSKTLAKLQALCHHIVFMYSKDPYQIARLFVIILCSCTAKTPTWLHSSASSYCVHEQLDPNQITRLCVIILWS